MTKDAIASSISVKLGIPKTRAHELIDAFAEEIGAALEKGERVALPGFGSFSIAERAARIGRHPGTGEPLSIPAKKAIKFSPASALVGSVNEK